MNHGSKTFEVTAPRSRFYQGAFGRIFPDLPPWFPVGVADHKLEEHFLAFASAQMVEFPGIEPSALAAEAEPTAPGSDPLDSAIPSGYVYFGQFVDHDLTLDVTTLSAAELDPNRLHNFRTPRLDLDSLYGQGPQAQPHLYEHVNGAFTGKFLLGPFAPGPFKTPAIGTAVFADLPRNAESMALIGDPRNDENVIVAQIHLAFLLAHNRLVDRSRHVLGADTPAEALFSAARKTLRWLYQWIVWKDFVRRITDPIVHGIALASETQADGRVLWRLGYKDDIYNWKSQPFMPVEFSVAAYRFGHSMVRNAYQTNSNSGAAGFGTFFPIFDRKGNTNLGGGVPLDLRRVVQWDWFLNMESSVAAFFPQMARKLDPKLANALMHLPEDPAAPGDPKKPLNVLAARNLTRGVRMKLPSGEDVAMQLGIEPLDLATNEPRTLWYYILKEAALEGASGGAGSRLGTVGSIIVAATFAGILKGDPLSWFNQQPAWSPETDPLLIGDFGEADTIALDADGAMAGNVPWGLPAIIRLSRLPVDGGPFRPVEATA